MNDVEGLIQELLSICIGKGICFSYVYCEMYPYIEIEDGFQIDSVDLYGNNVEGMLREFIEEVKSS